MPLKQILLIAVLILPFAHAILVYPNLPSEIPVYWSLIAEPVGSMRLPWGAFLLPSLAVLILVLFRLFIRRVHDEAVQKYLLDVELVI